jgi:hypothetical protein
VCSGNLSILWLSRKFIFPKRKIKGRRIGSSLPEDFWGCLILYRFYPYIASKPKAIKYLGARSGWSEGVKAPYVGAGLRLIGQKTVPAGKGGEL